MTGKKENIIEVAGLRKSFGPNKVLAGLDLTLKKNELLAVLGRSGSGKSVLLKCLVRLVEPDAGSIRIYGKNVPELDRAELDGIRRKIGYVFQGGALYDSMTVQENLAFPIEKIQNGRLKKGQQEQIRRSLRDVGMEDAINKYPSELSGGMQKRVALARVLVIHPEIIFYDEPTAGLDPITAQEISELILSTKKDYNTSAIMITHDIYSTEGVADRVAMLRDGAIFSEGSMDELKHHEDEWMQQYFRVK